jgi:hypothetical protein
MPNQVAVKSQLFDSCTPHECLWPYGTAYPEPPIVVVEIVGGGGAVYEIARGSWDLPDRVYELMRTRGKATHRTLGSWVAHSYHIFYIMSV